MQSGEQTSSTTQYIRDMQRRASAPRTPAPAATPAPVTAPTTPAAPGWRDTWQSMFPDQNALQGALGQLLPAYQSRLGGLTGPTEDAMRLRGQQAIQSQYGNALRSAMSQGAAQGMRGAAGVAMQNDIRNQMGQAQANMSRDLVISDWDAKRQALADLAGFTTGERGGILGTHAGIEQLANTNRGFDQYGRALGGMGQGGGGNMVNAILNPQTMIGLPSVPFTDRIGNQINSWF